MWVETVKYPWSTYKDPDIKRQFKLMSVLGTDALPEDKLKKVSTKSFDKNRINACIHYNSVSNIL